MFDSKLALTPYELLKYSLCSAAAGIYIKDCYEVFSVLQSHNSQITSPNSAESDTLGLAKFYDYAEDNEDLKQVTSPDFKCELEKLQKELEGKDPKLGIAPEDLERSYRIVRESVAFLGGGRAALLQLAHPFVAAGIAQHSNLKRVGVQERFYNTFKHMFAITYGDLQKVLKSAKIVRRLHEKVEGEIGEDVGYFSKHSKYDANNLHALFWVHATLVEGSIMMHEMYIRRLSETEKDTYIRDSKIIGQTFGIPQSYLPDTWKEFTKMFGKMLNSNILTVSSDAKMIDDFLWTPPAPRFAPLIKLVRWSTAVKLPPKVAQALYHRKITRLDIFFWCIVNGFVRFVYRLLPWSARWLTPYLKLRERMGYQYSYPHRVLMRFSEYTATQFLDSVMPPKHLKHKED